MKPKFSNNNIELEWFADFVMDKLTPAERNRFLEVAEMAYEGVGQMVANNPLASPTTAERVLEWFVYRYEKIAPEEI